MLSFSPYYTQKCFGTLSYGSPHLLLLLCGDYVMGLVCTYFFKPQQVSGELQNLPQATHRLPCLAPSLLYSNIFVHVLNAATADFHISGLMWICFKGVRILELRGGFSLVFAVCVFIFKSVVPLRWSSEPSCCIYGREKWSKLWHFSFYWDYMGL